MARDQVSSKSDFALAPTGRYCTDPPGAARRSSRRCSMNSMADQVADAPAARPVGVVVPETSSAARPVSASTMVLPVIGERELRLDLFRGMALWLIFIDHLPPSLLTWFTIRNYGFSDATEIFIFISGYTAAFVYGRAMLDSGFMVATARILRRVWQID